MNIRSLSFLAATIAATSASVATPTTSGISGDYLEVRSCDIYTGPCFANAEMGLTGKEGMLVWNVKHGDWQGTSLDGLSVIAVVRTDATLSDQQYQPRTGKAVLVVDDHATPQQKTALVSMAKGMSGKLIGNVVSVKSAEMNVALGTCTKSGCAKVKAGNLVEIATRCMGDGDHVCGNESLYYPPLTQITDARPAFSELAAYRGDGLGMTWQGAGQRNVYLGSFTR